MDKPIKIHDIFINPNMKKSIVWTLDSTYTLEKNNITVMLYIRKDTPIISYKFQFTTKDKFKTIVNLMHNASTCDPTNLDPVHNPDLDPTYYLPTFIDTWRDKYLKILITHLTKTANELQNKGIVPILCLRFHDMVPTNCQIGYFIILIHDRSGKINATKSLWASRKIFYNIDNYNLDAMQSLVHIINIWIAESKFDMEILKK